MGNLFNVLMERGMRPHTPAPPTQAVGMWSQPLPPKPSGPPQQNRQAIGPGPGAASPPGMMPPNPMNRG